MTTDRTCTNLHMINLLIGKFFSSIDERFFFNQKWLIMDAHSCSNENENIWCMHITNINTNKQISESKNLLYKNVN